MIDAFENLAQNAPDFPVYAEFEGHDNEDLQGRTCTGWFHTEAEAEAAAELARGSIGCRHAIVVPKRYLLPSLLATVLLYSRIANGERVDFNAEASEIMEEHGTWPFGLSLVLIEPVVTKVAEERIRRKAAKTKPRRSETRRAYVSSRREVATC
ncbi:hypothetical protein QU487_22240 [Crenobacter sp. SG2305]|uniref:hypothetical protein n=1 Tax=Crenobacter oryzisoli TaxID=3056844 RepID=UPI0025AA39CD|nr:hypothetical protein [Crenobacter sp. SG2305]MDN0085423.1 hypothetical protein [Crenobacter sp. SG2305]